MRLTRRMTLEDFLDDYIGPGFVIALVVIFFFFIAIAGVTATRRHDRFAEQDLYFALQGQDFAGDRIVSERAHKMAKATKKVFAEGPMTAQEFRDLNFQMERSNSPNSLRFALEHEEKIREVLANPQKDFYVPLPSYGYWFALAGFFSWLFLSLCASVSYTITTATRGYLRETGDEAWQYPWNKWWAYPCFILFMLPWFIPTYTCVLIYALTHPRQVFGRRTQAQEQEVVVIEGAPVEIIEQARAGENVGEIAFEPSPPDSAYEQKKKGVRDQIRQIQKAEKENRKRWAELRSQEDVLKEQTDAQAAVEKNRNALSELGRKIQELQHALAESQAKLASVDALLETYDPEEDYGSQFDEILRVPGVLALQVFPQDRKVQVYTDTVYIHDREIGMFRIDCKPDGLALYNICNSHHKGQDHPFGSGGYFCFGDMDVRVKEHLKKREYVRLVKLVLQAIHSAEGIGGSSLGGWRSVPSARRDTMGKGGEDA